MERRKPQICLQAGRKKAATQSAAAEMGAAGWLYFTL